MFIHAVNSVFCLWDLYCEPSLDPYRCVQPFFCLMPTDFRLDKLIKWMIPSSSNFYLWKPEHHIGVLCCQILARREHKSLHIRMNVSPHGSKNKVWLRMWGRESDPLRFQLSTANPTATPRGERERTAKISAALTQRVHMRAGGVNPVSNKLGLTLVNPTTTGANAATQNEIPGPLTYTCPCAYTQENTHVHPNVHCPYITRRSRLYHMFGVC